MSQDIPKDVKEISTEEAIEFLKEWKDRKEYLYIKNIMSDFIDNAKDLLKDKNFNYEILVGLLEEPENKSVKWFNIVILTDIDDSDKKWDLWGEFEEKNQETIDKKRENAKTENQQDMITVANALISSTVTIFTTNKADKNV